MSLPVCILVVCTLLSGGGPKQCAPASMERLDAEEIQTFGECQALFHAMKRWIPRYERMVAYDFGGVRARETMACTVADILEASKR